MEPMEEDVPAEEINDAKEREKEKRAKVLGFRPQRELSYNRLLPYADKIDEESALYLEEIKENLGKAVLLHELKPGCLLWLARFSRYIRLYGMKFSKEDHVRFVKLCFHLLIMENTDAQVVQKVCSLLTVLLKKQELLTREDLELPWRPLYELFERFCFSSNHGMGLVHYNEESIRDHLVSVVSVCNPYFPLNATQEMLDEWRPLLCPWDVTMQKAVRYFSFFLPTDLPPAYHDHGFKLWFDELIGIWESSRNQPSWDPNAAALFTMLFSRLACDVYGYVDFEPYLPELFDRLMNSFGLPVLYKNTVVVKATSSSKRQVSKWVVSCLGGGSSCQSHLETLFKATESYFHPSNSGPWQKNIFNFIAELTTAFIDRIQFERYKKPRWFFNIPEKSKLTDQDIDRFVDCVLPVAYLALFTKSGVTHPCIAVHQLALLRPDKVIPNLVEKFYASLETVTEPHRLISCSFAMISVCRPMICSSKFYPQGPTHVIPLMLAALPAIDPNDIRKTLVTLQFVVMFSSLIPIVDSSCLLDTRTDLTETEQTVCLTTASLEEFVLQFIDRCLVVVEANTRVNIRMEKENERMSVEEKVFELALKTALIKILTQCSDAIFDSALERIHSFLTNRILEVRVSGRIAASFAKALANVNPEKTYKAFLPGLFRKIMHLTETEESLKEEHPDSELLYSLLLLSEVTRGNGQALLPYKQDLLNILPRLLKLESEQSYTFVGKLLKHIMKNLTTYYILNMACVTEIASRSLDDWVPVRDWGKLTNQKELDLNWHIPTTEETQFALEVLHLVLKTEMAVQERFISGEKVSKEVLLKSLMIVNNLVCGAGFVLPGWVEDHIRFADSGVKLIPVPLYLCDPKALLNYNSQNVRMVLVEATFSLIDKIMEVREDDTKSLVACYTLLQTLTMNYGLSREEWDSRKLNFDQWKHNLSSGLSRKKDQFRWLLAEKAQLAHFGRVVESNNPCPYVTPTLLRVLDYMVKLATSHYSEVRIKGQQYLDLFSRIFSYSSSMIYGRIEKSLALDPEAHHEEFKGALYVLLNMRLTSISVNSDLDVLAKAWPTLISTKFSEKLSIIQLLEKFVKGVKTSFRTMTFGVTMTPEVLSVAAMMVSNVGSESVQQGKTKALAGIQRDKETHRMLVENLASRMVNDQLHWRHYRLAFVMLNHLVREDSRFPAKAVAVTVSNLVHDDLSIRKLAIRTIDAIMKQQKIHAAKIVIDPLTFCGPSAGIGERPENSWMQYNSKTCPKTAEQWDEPRFVHKTHWGFYAWPKEFKIFAPSKNQPKFSRPRDELTEEEKPIFDFFTDEDKVQKLMDFLSLEDKKGKDKFSSRNFWMFKLLFRNFEDSVLAVFKPHLERLVEDKRESYQRCAAELVAGLIRGAKHWNFERTESLWSFLCPTLRKAFCNITVETIGDWGTCMATASESRDPNRLHWLLELLMEDPIREEEGSFAETSRLYVLQGGLSQQEWRVSELNCRLMEYLRPFLTHPYQNVRNRLGSVVTNIFLQDTILPGLNTTHSPVRRDFLNEVIPKMEILKEDRISAFEDEPRKEVLRMFKTICQIISGLLTREPSGANAEMFDLLPILCANESSDIDPELSRDCVLCLACLSKVILGPGTLQKALDVIEAVTKGASWKARATCLDFFQCLVFTNMFTVVSRTGWVDRVVKIVVDLLKDERVEVREKAGKVLGGLLHCDFVPSQTVKSLQGNFASYARTKLPKRTGGTNGIVNGSAASVAPLILERHSGLLGLCAFVNAHPYDVPDYLPDILMILGDHINDPQPIPATVKKTLSDFKRTHHDTWHEHKEKFSDDQLVVLTDLLVSPSYYA